jgi:hypothetical protein
MINFFCVCVGPVWTQGFTLAKEALYSLSQTPMINFYIAEHLFWSFQYGKWRDQAKQNHS